MKKSGILRVLCPLLSVLLILIFLLLLPGNDLAGSSWWSTYHIDKVIHVLAFAMLALSMSISLSKLRVFTGLNYRLMTLIFVVGSVFGTILEFLQQELRAGRAAELLDIVADSVGLLLGFLIFRTVYGVFPGVIPPDSVISNRRTSQK